VRSLVTSVSTLFPVLALMLFGGETLKDFGFALLVGIASGAYSSIFIATPVLTHWKEREPVYRRRTQAALQAHGGTIPAYADGSVGDVDAEAAAATARHREPRARRRAAAQRAASQRGPTRPKPSTTSTTSSTATADRAESQAQPQPPADEPAEVQPPVPTDAAASSDPGSGDGASGPAEPQAEEHAQRQATDDKPRGKGNRARRKKHGRR
jgi:SecD/SecF fusion protein